MATSISCEISFKLQLSRASNPPSFLIFIQRLRMYFRRSTRASSTMVRVGEVDGSMVIVADVGWGRRRIDDTMVWYTIPAYFSLIPLFNDSMTHPTLSASPKPAPSPSRRDTHSESSKHASHSRTRHSSTDFLAVRTISRTISAQASIALSSLRKACWAAKSKGNTLAGVVRFASPFRTDSRVFCGRAANSEVHQPSPKSPTSALRAPLSRYLFCTSSATENSSTLGTRLAH